MTLAWSVSCPGSTGSRAVMDWAGVRWVLPPKGMVTLPAPMVESNRSTSPRREAQGRLAASSRKLRNLGCPIVVRSFSRTDTAACFTAPLVSRKARLRSAIVLPRHFITILGLSVTTATRYASRFSVSARKINSCSSSGATTTAMRS